MWCNIPHNVVSRSSECGVKYSNCGVKILRMLCQDPQNVVSRSKGSVVEILRMWCKDPQKFRMLCQGPQNVVSIHQNVLSRFSEFDVKIPRMWCKDSHLQMWCQVNRMWCQVISTENVVSKSTPFNVVSRSSECGVMILIMVSSSFRKWYPVL